MAKVYLLFSGSYSARGVVGAYSTKEKMELAKDLLCADDVEEWELDQIPNHSPTDRPWEVFMTADGYARANRVALSNEFPLAVQGEPSGIPDTMLFKVMAPDKEHAIKIASEKRRQLIAENQWEPDYETAQWKKQFTANTPKIDCQLHVYPTGRVEVWAFGIAPFLLTPGGEKTTMPKRIKTISRPPARGWSLAGLLDHNIAEAKAWCAENHCSVAAVVGEGITIGDPENERKPATNAF